MNEEYIAEIVTLAKNVNDANPKINLFAKRQKGKVPTQAFSEFLTNKEQGDWAESLILDLLENNLTKWKSISYGRNESLIAGDENFKEFYENYQNELESIGKCPDILIFDKKDFNKDVETKLKEGKKREDLVEVVGKAKAGLEVRSSAFLADQYVEFMKTKIKGKTKSREFLSFTPKVEDIAVILKWIEKHGVPHYYVQVLFDSAYVISFKKILELLADPDNLNKKYFIEKNSKNQFKSTIHINLNEGFKIIDKNTLPEHKSEVRRLPRGRLLFYVKFISSKLPKFEEKILTNAFNLA